MCEGIFHSILFHKSFLISEVVTVTSYNNEVKSPLSIDPGSPRELQNNPNSQPSAARCHGTVQDAFDRSGGKLIDLAFLPIMITNPRDESWWNILPGLLLSSIE